MFADAYRRIWVSRFMCKYALTLSLFMFLFYAVLFCLQKFNLTFIQKGCVCQKLLFFSNEINFCCNEISFFYFKLLFPTKVSQNGFNFNQTESYVYSKFQSDTLVSHGDLFKRLFYINIYRHCFVLLLLLLLLLLNVITVTKTQNFRKNRNIKGALSGLRQFLATESPLKMMRNAFYFTSKALFVIKVFKSLP